jgi:hypothetical protein
VIER